GNLFRDVRLSLCMKYVLYRKGMKFSKFFSGELFLYRIGNFFFLICQYIKYSKDEEIDLCIVRNGYIKFYILYLFSSSRPTLYVIIKKELFILCLKMRITSIEKGRGSVVCFGLSQY